MLRYRRLYNLIGRTDQGQVLRLTTGFIGGAAVLGSLLALALPLNIGEVDRSGAPIGCGVGLRPDLSVARHEDEFNRRERDREQSLFIASDYARACTEIVARRRRTAIPVVAGGAIAVIGTTTWAHRRRAAASQPAATASAVRPQGRNALRSK